MVLSGSHAVGVGVVIAFLLVVVINATPVPIWRHAPMHRQASLRIGAYVLVTQRR